MNVCIYKETQYLKVELGFGILTKLSIAGLLSIYLGLLTLSGSPNAQMDKNNHVN